MPHANAPSLISRAEWLGARAALAGSRIGRFATGATAAFLVVLLVLLVVPQLGISVPGLRPRTYAWEDTLPLARSAELARTAAIRADSEHARLSRRPASNETDSAAAESALPSQRGSLQRDITELEGFLDRALKAPLPVSYLALANAAAMRGLPQLSRLTDSLATLDRRRAAIASAAGSERSYAQYTAKIAEVGVAIRELAVRRLATLGSDRAAGDTAGLRTIATNVFTRDDRDYRRAIAEIMRDSLTALRARNAARDAAQAAARTRANERVPPIAMLVAATVLAVLAGYLVSLVSEVSRPTIANAREMESAAGCPVIEVAQDAQPVTENERMDPFAMLYLRVAAGVIAHRAIVLGGDERSVVATVAARLALASAGDARATLVVDADAESSPVAGYYRQRPEPGLTDALAGVRLWREVARPVGASAGLSIDVVPGGTIRVDELAGGARQVAREEFARFRAEYDLCMVVAPSTVAWRRLAGMLEDPLVIVCAVRGESAIARLSALVGAMHAEGFDVSEGVLWGAALPHVESRSRMLSRTSSPMHQLP